MGEVVSDITFKELTEALSNDLVKKTSDGKISIRGTVLSGKDFDKLYLVDVKDLFSKYETSISPEFAPSSDVYSALEAFSNPALKSTNVSEIAKSFKKKLSTAILNEYGTKFNGAEILEHAEQGHVEPADVITMLKYKSLYAQDAQSEDYIEPVSYNQLLDFYSPEKHPGRMLEMLKENQFSQEFKDFHEEMLENVSPKDKKEYIEDLIEEARKEATTSQEFSTNILEYANNKIIPDENLEKNISGEFLKQQYLDGKISISRVIEIYSTSKKYFSAVQSILTYDEITKAHEQDKLSDDALMYIPKDSRVAYLQKHNTKFSTMMYLFLHCNGFSVSELSLLLQETDNKENLEFYIDAGSDAERIKELYENYLLDYASIKHLHSIGIISEKDMQRYHFSINKASFYQELDNTKNVSISGNGNAVPFSSTGFFIKEQQSLIAPSLDVYRILGKKNEQEFSELPIITHKDDNSNDSFLNNYRIVGLQFSNLVAFIPLDATKPIYIMPYQEAAYIIKNHRLPENFAENDLIKEVRVSEKTNEEILRVANQFEEARSYLETANYHEDYDFASNYEIMLEQYQKIKIKGEN